MRPVFVLLGVLALTALVYLPGLNGPYVFDDQPNLKPLLDWLNGTTVWQEALLGNRSGLFGRPLSMLSFVLNAQLFGIAAYSFKVTNLGIHLACGALLYSLLRRLLSRDRRLAKHVTSAALLISAVWLIHPVQVSTVLYVVQRMAQLSTLFILIGLNFYVNGRFALEQGRRRDGLIWLFVGVPAATLTAILCKENGALTPLLCGVLEMGYFASSTQVPRPRVVRNFFFIGLLLPALMVVGWYLWPPARLLAGYSARTFTLGERLLSEPRALWDYIGALLLPRGPSLGVYTDDFPVSHGLMAPPTTLFAIIALIALILLALLARRRAPAVFTGIAFYLAGHLMESSVFPLELYFEHRNYLPSAGLFLALLGAFEWLFDKLPAAEQGSAHRRLLIIASIALCATLAMATAARAWVWQSWTTMVKQAVEQHPQSIRAQFDYLEIVWHESTPGDTKQMLDRIAASSNPVAQHLSAVYSVILRCDQHETIREEDRARISATAGSKLQLSEMQAFEQLGGYLRDHDCEGFSKVSLANILREIVDAAPQPQSNVPVWRTRFTVASLYDYGGQPDEALTQAEKAWDTGAADSAVGIFLIRLQLYKNDIPGAIATRTQLRKRIASWDFRNQNALAAIDQQLPP